MHRVSSPHLPPAYPPGKSRVNSNHRMIVVAEFCTATSAMLANNPRSGRALHSHLGHGSAQPPRPWLYTATSAMLVKRKEMAAPAQTEMIGHPALGAADT